MKRLSINIVDSRLKHISYPTYYTLRPLLDVDNSFKVWYIKRLFKELLDKKYSLNTTQRKEIVEWLHSFSISKKWQVNQN